jgi:hypothetical protein
MTSSVSNSLNIQPPLTSQDDKNSFKKFVEPVLIAGAEKTIIRSFKPAFVRASHINHNNIESNRINYAPQNPADVGFTLNINEIEFEIDKGNFKPIFIDGLKQWLKTANGKTAPKIIQKLAQDHILNSTTGKRAARRARGKARNSSPQNSPNGKKPENGKNPSTVSHEATKTGETKFDYTPRPLIDAPQNVRIAVKNWEKISEKSKFTTGDIVIANPLRATVVKASDLNAHMPGNLFDKIPNGFARVKGLYDGKIHPLVYKTTLIVISAETLDIVLKGFGYFK